MYLHLEMAKRQAILSDGCNFSYIKINFQLSTQQTEDILLDICERLRKPLAEKVEQSDCYCSIP